MGVWSQVVFSKVSISRSFEEPERQKVVAATSMQQDEHKEKRKGKEEED